jgi:hypothetical protein
MSSEIYNPSLRQVPRSAKAPILPASGESSILAWLEDIGRLRSRDPIDAKMEEEADSEELSDLMGNEDSFEEDDDSDMALDEDED